MNHSPADDSGRPPASAAGERRRGEVERLNTEAERRRARPELAAWHERFFASPLPELLKERTHLKFRDLRSQRREREAGEVRTFVEGALAAGALAQLPALANRLGQAAAITGESATAEACFVAATAGLPDGPGRSIVLQNLLMVQLDRRENGAAARTIADLAQFAPHDLPLPLARFEIERPLGFSMFGMVFLCREIATGRRVVVKSPPESPPGRLQPLREAEILLRVSHPGVPVCYDLGHVDPAGRRPFYVLEWFDGISLHDYAARFGPLSWANFRPILTQLVETLHALHQEAIIHCDLKPGNVLVRCDHTGWHVKLIDFGIAVLADDPAAAIVPGEPRPFTLGFGAPEQHGPTEHQRLTTAADLYGLGRTILFCLCGQPDPPADKRDLLPEGLASIVANCLAIDPGLRPSAAELLEQLAALPLPDGPPRFPSTHLTAGTSSSGEPGTQDSASPDDRSDTRIPKQPGTG
ncbi:MAG: serine/threonine protein kinase [Planctomycetaceae bacterium]|nr:serine/threonine protein kinase [Planctomycetaceae bacterium]